MDPLYILIIGAVIVFVIFLIFGKKSSKEPFSDTSIDKLVKQAAKWSLESTTDQNPITSAMHANYGAAYLLALSDIASDKQIEDATGIDMLKFRNEIMTAQDNAMRKLSNVCQAYIPNNSSYLMQIANS